MAVTTGGIVDDSAMSSAWPFHALRLRTPRLELRLPDDADLAELAELAVGGVHAADEMPFDVPWTAAAGDELRRGVLQFHWRIRATLAPEAWVLNFTVVEDGRIVGAQGIDAERFAVSRTVSTGSWLGQAHQGRGIGREMRAAVLELAFAGLGADRAESAAFTDNPASIAVSRALGYVDNGTEVKVVQDRARPSRSFLLTRKAWEATDRIGVTIEGLEPCLPLLGAGR
jgi:RimJ/RimL family protein N-acetyltransferase